MKEIVKKIIAVEEAARGEVDAAREEGEKLLREADRQAVRILEEAEKQARAEADKLIRKVRRLAEEEKLRAVRAAKEKGEDLRRRYRGRIDKVAAALMQRVLP